MRRNDLMRNTHTHYCRSHRILDCDISDLRGPEEAECATGHAAHEPDPFAFAAEDAAETDDNRRSGHEIVARLCHLLTDGADAAEAGKNALLLAYMMGRSDCKTHCQLAKRLGLTRSGATRALTAFRAKCLKIVAVYESASPSGAIVDAADGLQARVSSEALAGERGGNLPR